MPSSGASAWPTREPVDWRWNLWAAKKKPAVAESLDGHIESAQAARLCLMSNHLLVVWSCVEHRDSYGSHYMNLVLECRDSLHNDPK